MDDDMILPDDYTEETAPPEAEETLEPVETENDTTQTEQQEESQIEDYSPFLKALSEKMKFNHGPAEINSIDEAVPLMQKGMNYDKLQERLNALESDPRLSYVEKQANKHSMSVPEYLQAVEAREEQDRLDELINQNIPEEYAKEMLAARKDREERQVEKKAQEEQIKRDQELNGFLAYFQEENGRAFDSAKDSIPKEVSDAYNSGTPLKYAYMEYHSKQLKTQLKVSKQNEENIKRAPAGSVTAHGSTEVAEEDDFMKGFNSI